MPDTSCPIADNLARIRQRIAEAALKSGRAPDAVRLVAVTKYVGQDEIRRLIAAGVSDLGESRPQDLWEKAALLSGQAVHWHMVGHLQRNKVRRTLPLVSLVHSVDSLRLAAAIDEAAEELAHPVTVLLEVNISGDSEKHGFAPAELEAALLQAAGWQGMQVRGLMAMASRTGGMEIARRNFAELRQLRDRLAAVCPPGVLLDELSMGMSDDFEAAIEAGATIVRVGSALFDGLPGRAERA